MMSAQTAEQTKQPSSSQTTSRQERNSQQTSLARQNILPSVPSLLLDPLGFFDDSPFTVLRRLQQEINRAFAQPGPNSISRTDGPSPLWIPPVEVGYRDGNFVVSAELPGLSNEDVTVEITDDAVVIQGERQFVQEENEGGIQRTERRYGHFYRAIALPEGAKTDQARAEFQNGVLKISVPAPQPQSNARQIPIETGASQSKSESQPAKSQTAGQTTQKAA
ncbi:MAG: Hsp20/alpha crystallin family protein [Candidatus Acidiferrum sp.]